MPGEMTGGSESAQTCSHDPTTTTAMALRLINRSNTRTLWGCRAGGARTRDQRISGEPFRGKSADSHHVQYNNTFRNFCDRLKLADSGSFPVIFGE